MTPHHEFDDKQTDDDFLIREGLELLAAYRRIRSSGAREAVLKLIQSIVEAEQLAAASTEP